MTTPPNGVLTAGNTTTLVIVNPQLSDAGVYQCTFKELKLQRFINLCRLACIAIASYVAITAPLYAVISTGTSL